MLPCDSNKRLIMKASPDQCVVSGCATDADCDTGLECVGEGYERKCMDYNECTDARFTPTSSAYCGDFTTCENSVGGYSCHCITGSGATVQFALLSLTALFQVTTTGWQMWAAVKWMSVRTQTILQPPRESERNN